MASSSNRKSTVMEGELNLEHIMALIDGNETIIDSNDKVIDE